MKSISKFFRLSSKSRRLVCQSVVLALGLTLGKTVFPIQKFCSFLKGLTKFVGMHSSSPFSFSDIAWAVQRTCKLLPGCSTCLVQASVASVLLAWNQHEAILHLGVAKDRKKGLQAHAWVESQGKWIVGGEIASRFVPLAVWNIRSKEGWLKPRCNA